MPTRDQCFRQWRTSVLSGILIDRIPQASHERHDTSVMTGYSKGSRIRITSNLVRWHCLQTSRTMADILFLTDLDGTDYRLLRARTSKQEPLCDASRSVVNSRDVTFPTFHQPFNIYFNTVSTTVISNTSLSLRTCVPHPSKSGLKSQQTGNDPMDIQGHQDHDGKWQSEVWIKVNLSVMTITRNFNIRDRSICKMDILNFHSGL